MDFDFKRIAEGAQVFLNVVSEYIEKPNKSPGIATIPYQVCLTFSCELYMKAIIVHDYPNISQPEIWKLGHSLSSLYEKLAPCRKERIGREIPDSKIAAITAKRTISYQSILHSDLSREVKNMANYKLETFPQTFIEMLQIHSRSFEEWRYFYENVEGSTPLSYEMEFMYPFTLTLHNIICAIFSGESDS